MAHFAEIDSDGTVLRVLAVSDADVRAADGNESEATGVAYCKAGWGGERWVQTSYNTRGGKHLNGGTPLRKNYAGVGHKYDEGRDAFISLQPFPSWSLNEGTCLWESPAAMPMDGGHYDWNEELMQWVEA